MTVVICYNCKCRNDITETHCKECKRELLSAEQEINQTES